MRDEIDLRRGKNEAIVVKRGDGIKAWAVRSPIVSLMREREREGERVRRREKERERERERERESERESTKNGREKQS